MGSLQENLQVILVDRVDVLKYSLSLIGLECEQLRAYIPRRLNLKFQDLFHFSRKSVSHQETQVDSWGLISSLWFRLPLMNRQNLFHAF